jgi:probable addiction module antidote protein
MADQHRSPSLDTLEAIAAFLAHAFEAGDAEQIATALNAVSGTAALPELAAAAGLPRDALRASLQSGELSLEDTLAIMKVIDLHLPPRTGASQ